MYRAGSGDSGQTTWWASRVISGAEADWEERGLSSWPWPNSQPNCYLRDLALVITDALASSLFSLSVSLFPLPANKLNYIRGEKKTNLFGSCYSPFLFSFKAKLLFGHSCPPLSYCLLASSSALYWNDYLWTSALTLASPNPQLIWLHSLLFSKHALSGLLCSLTLHGDYQAL